VRQPVNILVVWIAATALQVAFPIAATAEDPQREDPQEREGESRWGYSLAVTSGVLLQGQDGSVDACLFANPANATGACPAPAPLSTPLRPASDDNDLAIAAFVGANLEVMSPALPVPTRPRLFLSGEILPTFAAKRDVAGEGDPGCVRGPEPGDPCASSEDPLNPRDTPFGQDSANGQGSVVSTDYHTLTFGANLGVAFPAQVGKRRLRIKPSFGWLSYEAKVSGQVVDATCVGLDTTKNPPEPTDWCTNVLNRGTGSLRETNLTGSDTRRFHAIGPGLDVEMDTGRFGPLGTSIFIGGHAYRTLGDRTVTVTQTQVYGNDGLPLANQAVSARWEVDFNAWMFRAGVGLRLQWLGSKQ
jgi:hypothetical protein